MVFGPVSPRSAPEAKTPCVASTSQVTRLEVSRDTWVSEVGQEADGNNGGVPRLKLKSIQERYELGDGQRDPAGR